MPIHKEATSLLFLTSTHSQSPYNKIIQFNKYQNLLILILFHERIRSQNPKLESSQD